MQKTILSLLVALMAMMAAQAQQISVVSANGTTSIHSTLQAAIKGASDGSVIYLPGGGFLLDDSVKIAKRLTIIGIGHSIKGGNIDGITIINGNLFFNGGSDGSAVMGCYITGNVNIGSDNPVNQVLIRYCNLNSVQVKSKSCLETEVNQNYIRNISSCSQAPVIICNNIMHSLLQVRGGIIKNNIFTSWGDAYTGSLNYIYSSIITNNIINCLWKDNFSGYAHFDNSTFSGNMHSTNFGLNCINISGKSWNDIFVNCNGFAISPESNFHFKEAFQQHSECGIYGGTGFSDSALPPVPYIVSKQIPEHTDAEGKLNIKIRVRAEE